VTVLQTLGLVLAKRRRERKTLKEGREERREEPGAV
jgi:hypothetical protein